MIEDENTNLIEKVAKGDKGAFDRLVKVFYKKAYAYLKRMTAQSAQAEDLVQEAFMILWQKAHTFKAGSAFEPWFYKILYNLSMDYYRSSKHETALFDEQLSSKDNTPFDSRIADEHSHRLEIMLGKLPPNERAVIVLFYYQQKNTKDIATILATSEQAVQSLLYRGRKTLKRWWQGH